MSCSITTRLAPVSSRIRRSIGASASASRWAMPLDGSSSRIDRGSVGEQAGEVDDPARPGRELPHELRAEGPQAEQLDQLVDPARDRALRVVRRRQAERRPQRVADLDPSLARDGDRSVDGERREQAGVLERAAEAPPAPALRVPSLRDVPRRRAGRGRRPAARSRTPASKSVVLPAPFGPMMPTTSPGATARRHSSTARMPPNEHDSSRKVERRRQRTPSTAGRPLPLPLVARGDGRRDLAAPSRNTERRTSGRSSSSAVGPWNRISPFSMKNAVVRDAERDVHRLLDEHDRRPGRRAARRSTAGAARRRRARDRATARRSAAASASTGTPCRAPASAAGRRTGRRRSRRIRSRRIGNSSSTLEPWRARSRPCPPLQPRRRAGGSRRPSATGTRRDRRAPG